MKTKEGFYVYFLMNTEMHLTRRWVPVQQGLDHVGVMYILTMLMA